MPSVLATACKSQRYGKELTPLSIEPGADARLGHLNSRPRRETRLDLMAGEEGDGKHGKTQNLSGLALPYLRQE
ncbi:hypothetical protein C5748_03980 [Phyllobacterium phragmitis]|uniref:Uncharacterized protein n=1 Tax=Phyllobacterium phragmitis TaxID=2670329 RepID=A0A2S9IXW0_9HYPH|nr:hypothetical protein C5748_03980 [Phyllobacterium phragmitis]